jgi:alanine racemase
MKKEKLYTKKNKKTYNKVKKNKTFKIKCKSEIPSMYKNINATIDINAFKHNINYLKKKAKTDIMPVLKANAYGHGIVEMSKICRISGIKYIGVATLGEAIQIRNSGDKGRILGWLYDVTTNEVRDAALKNIDIGIFDENHIPIISKSLPKGVKAKIHLFVDTGIDRNGIPYDKAVDAAKQIVSDPKFELVGLMSHLCCATEKLNNKPTLKQFEIFRKVRQDLADLNIKPELVHIGNTAGILDYDLSDFTLSRSGTGIYGYGSNKLIPIMDITSKIIQLKYVPKGAGIGYDRTFVAHKKTYIGIVPIGYADFLPLTKSGELSVIVNGTKRKILGLESMDQIVIEAKKGDNLGDKVDIFGKKNKNFLSGEEFAKMGHTTIHNILTHIGNRVDHVYLLK